MNFKGFKKKLLIEKAKKQYSPHRIPKNKDTDKYVIDDE